MSNPYRPTPPHKLGGGYYVTEPENGQGDRRETSHRQEEGGDEEEEEGDFDEEEYDEEEEEEDEEEGYEYEEEGDAGDDYYNPSLSQNQALHHPMMPGVGLNPYDNPTTFEPGATTTSDSNLRRGMSYSESVTNRNFSNAQGLPPGRANLKSRARSIIPSRDCLDSLFTHVNTDLLICKSFYFFFFAAFGSLFPLLGIYLKQLGFNPKQVGIVIGFRPFVEMCGAPLWGTIAEKYQRAKHILLLSLVCWIVFTLSLAFVSTKPAGCIIFNDTHRFFEPPIYMTKNNEPSDDIKTMSPEITQPIVEPLSFLVVNGPDIMNGYQQRRKVRRDIALKDFFDIKRKGHKLPKGYVIGKSPVVITSEWLVNYPESVKVLVKPTFSNVLYDEKEVQRSFLIFLMLMVVGEFFAAPSLPLADSATLGYLGSDSNNYGKQRMFGSLGWGLSMFFVGVALDQSTSFPDHPCGDHDPGEKNYTICFAVFSVLMSLAFIAASQFYFKYQTEEDFIQMKDMEEESAKDIDYYKKGLNFSVSGQDPFETYEGQGIAKTYAVDNSTVSVPPLLDDFGDNFASKTGQTNAIENRNFAFNNNDDNSMSKPPRPPRPDAMGRGNNNHPQGKKGGSHGKSSGSGAPRIFRQNELKANLPEWMKALKSFNTPYHASFLFISFYMGLGMGFVFTFLFWHLQDVGGSPTVFGIASIINHMSELMAYFFSVRLITQFGHIKILYMGLVANTLRFLYISWLTNPWWVLPFEFLQGLTHAAVWVACCSFVTQTTPTHLRSSAQAILQTLHHGLGRGFGSVFGGFLIHSFGSRAIFRAYGFISAVLLLGFYIMNKYFGKKLPFPTIEAEQIHEEQLHLDPHGLPFNPISRDVSRNRLSEYQDSNEPTKRPANLGAQQSSYNMDHLVPGY